MGVWYYINIENVISLFLIFIFIIVICIILYYVLKFMSIIGICKYLEDRKIRIIFITSIIITLIFINVAIWMPRTILINGFNDETSFIPPFVVVFSVIGSLMYFYASTISEWIEKKKNMNETDSQEFHDLTFCDKLKKLDIERKILRVMAAPLMAIGIYLLFDLIFYDLNVTTERQVSNVSLMNLTVKDLINEIEATNKIENLIEIKAGISFLAGAFVKQFLDLTSSLAEKIVKRNNSK